MKKLIMTLYLLGAVVSAHAQGTPGILRCSSNLILDVYTTREPSSPIIARVKCGDPILLIEQRFGSPHIRTVDGKDGYIIGINLGQWSFEPEATATPNSTTAPGISSPSIARQPTAIAIDPSAAPRVPLETFRRFDIGWDLLSYSRQGSANLYGGDLSFTVHVSDRVGIAADLAVHTTIENPTVTTTTYRFGPRFYAARTHRVSTFGEFLAGGTRVTGSSTTTFLGIRNTTSVAFNGFALAVGGGVEMTIKPWLAWRAVHADYSLLRFGGAVSNGARIGTGIVFRFGS